MILDMVSGVLFLGVCLFFIFQRKKIPMPPSLAGKRNALLAKMILPIGICLLLKRTVAGSIRASPEL